MTDGVRRRGISILATFARGGSHAIFLAIVAMTSVPAVAVHIAGVRAGKYAGHQQPASLTWQEIVGLVCSSVLALGFSVLGGAQLKAWIRPAVTLWRPAMTEAWILLFFLLATLELRALALDVGVLPAPIGGPLIAAMTIWVFLIGYLAKIPWDRLVEIVGERIAGISHDTH